jgi:signal transduction histidine kinase
MEQRQEISRERRIDLRGELVRLLDRAASPEEFVHALFAVLDELIARDVRHPLVQALATELGRGAALPAVYAYLHDVRNILSAVRGNYDFVAEVLRRVVRGDHLRATEMAELPGAMADIEEAFRRAVPMLEEARAVTVETPGDRRAELRDVVEAAVRMVRRTHAHTTVWVEGVPQISVRASRVGMFRVLLNLLDNACDAVESQTDGTVTVEAWTSAVDAFVQVADNGCGIDAKLHDDVFDLFYSTKAWGSGMGLFVCRTQIRGWGGHLQIDSRPKEGARFTFSVPRADLE